MTDPFKFTTIAFAERSFLGPYNRDVILSLAGSIEGFAVDIGCGKGAVLEALGLPGIGIDINPAFAAEAQRRNPNCQILQEDARQCLHDLPQPPDLVICLGASQALGGPEKAWAQFAEIGCSHLLYGDCYWQSPPAREYLDYLGGREEDTPVLSALIGQGEPHGFAPQNTYVSVPGDWDAFEDTYYNSLINWCDANPEDLDSSSFRERITQWRQMYLNHGRHTLGYAITLYRREAATGS